MIYGHPQAIARKLRKLLDCEDVRRNMRAVVIDKAHLVVEWQVFYIWIELFPVTDYSLIYEFVSERIFLSNYALRTKNVTNKILNFFWNSQRVFL